jgi:hypothetical protein
VIFIKALRETFNALSLRALIAIIYRCKVRSSSSDSTTLLKQVRLLRSSIPLSPARL